MSSYHAINIVLFKVLNSIIFCFVLSVWLYRLAVGVPAGASQVFYPMLSTEAACVIADPVAPRSLFRQSKRDTFYDHAIAAAADKFGVEPAFIKAVIMAESSFNPDARSKVGAQGLMQLMPRTAAAMGVKDAFDPHHNILGGAKYLKHLLEQFDNDVKLALAAYNAGSRNVRRYNGVPPFKATQAYISKVLEYYDFYKESPSGGIS